MRLARPTRAHWSQVGVLALLGLKTFTITVVATVLFRHALTVVTPVMVERVATRVGPLDVRSRDTLSAVNREGLDSALAQLERAGLAVRPGLRVVLATTPAEQLLLTGSLSNEVLGGYSAVTDETVFPLGNQHRPGIVPVPVLTHELVHAALADALGRVSEATLPWWKAEGLASYVALHESEMALTEFKTRSEPATSIRRQERLHIAVAPDEPDEYLWARGMVTSVLDDPAHPSTVRVDLARVLLDTTSTPELARRLRRTNMLPHWDWDLLSEAESAVTGNPVLEFPVHTPSRTTIPAGKSMEPQS